MKTSPIKGTVVSKKGSLQSLCCYATWQDFLDFLLEPSNHFASCDSILQSRLQGRKDEGPCCWNGPNGLGPSFWATITGQCTWTPRSKAVYFPRSKNTSRRYQTSNIYGYFYLHKWNFLRVSILSPCSQELEPMPFHRLSFPEFAAVDS